MVVTAEKDRIAAIARTCRLLSRMNRSRPCDSIYYEVVGAYYERLMNAREQGKLVAAHTIFFPAELLTAMGVVPMHTEFTSWMIALFTGNVTDLLAKAAELGYAAEICSAHRLLAGGLNLGVLPRPDMVTWTNIVCDSSIKSGSHVKEFSGCPGFVLDYPFKRSREEDAYLMAELEDLVLFLEEQCGRRLDQDRLAATMARVDRQIQLFREIDRLRRSIPSPLPPQDFLKLMTVDCLASGEPRALDYLEALRDEIRGMVREGKGIVSPERFRILTIGMPPVRLMGAIDRISREHGAISVADPFLCEWGDERLDAVRPLDNVARKMNILPPMCMWGPLDRRATDRMVGSALDHGVQGAIYWVQLGCGQTGATVRYLKDAFSAIDVPMLAINADIVDVNQGTEDEVRQELERFYEFLAER